MTTSWLLCAYVVVLYILDTAALLAAMAAEEQTLLREGQHPQPGCHTVEATTSGMAICHAADEQLVQQLSAQAHVHTAVCCTMCLGLVVSWSLCAYGVVLHILDTPVVLAAVAAEGQKGGAINARPQHNWQPVTCGHGWVLHSRCVLTLCGCCVRVGWFCTC